LIADWVALWASLSFFYTLHIAYLNLAFIVAHPVVSICDGGASSFRYYMCILWLIDKVTVASLFISVNQHNVV
jgi:hypothetical protein